ncbi:hypothetical protein ILYODFUR_002136 [Ilyodon furcidens]|uniref:Uncharacterized protein n=1 Tax=Ilyodon furcidens TaxID=33524 RepID=A0ABV0UCN4_9TELE
MTQIYNSEGGSKAIPITHLQVTVHHAHLMAVKHRLQDLLDAMTACKHQGRGAHVSLSSATNRAQAGGGRKEGLVGGGGDFEGRTRVEKTLLLPKRHICTIHWLWWFHKQAKLFENGAKPISSELALNP